MWVTPGSVLGLLLAVLCQAPEPGVCLQKQVPGQLSGSPSLQNRFQVGLTRHLPLHRLSVVVLEGLSTQSEPDRGDSIKNWFLTQPENPRILGNELLVELGSEGETPSKARKDF